MDEVIFPSAALNFFGDHPLEKPEDLARHILLHDVMRNMVELAHAPA